jgi:Carboxypeptidase regulatory-like domain
LSRSIPKLFLPLGFAAWLSMGALVGGPGLAQAQEPPTPPPSAQPNREAPGTVAGTVVDQTGALVPGVHVKLTPANSSQQQETVTDGYGQFYFLNVPAGNFELTISATNFATQVVSGTVHPTEHYVAPQITLVIASATTQVTVGGLTEQEEAQQEVQQEEKQRVLGIIPNFFVSYVPDAAPLSTKQKFSLAWKSSSDPITIVLVAAIAGAEQQSNAFKGYGPGAQGYGKRFGATYADVFDGTFMGGAIFPALLKQDPRYFYKGTGSFRSRLFYALSTAFICKSDSKTWEPNYSNILGNLAAGGIANLYYPPSNRGAGLTFQTAGVRIGETAIAGVFQEFIVRKLTPGLQSSRRGDNQ